MHSDPAVTPKIERLRDVLGEVSAASIHPFHQCNFSDTLAHVSGSGTFWRSAYALEAVSMALGVDLIIPFASSAYFSDILE